MHWLYSELKAIYELDIRRLKGRLFLFLFNITPDFYFLKILKNIFLYLSGMNISIVFIYIKNNFYFDYANTLTIGKGTFINRNVAFEGQGNIIIGNSVQIGPNVQFATTTHKDKNKDETFEIKVGNNVWIGANCIILPGVEIADNITVAAGSVVRSKLLDGTLWAGNPAVKKR